MLLLPYTAFIISHKIKQTGIITTKAFEKLPNPVPIFDIYILKLPLVANRLKYAPNFNLKLSKSEIADAESLINSYSNNGSYSIYDGYDLKQLAINSKEFYKDAVVSTKSSTVINTNIDSKLKLANDKLADSLTENGFLDYYNNDNPLFKLDGTYYIVRVETIYNHKYVASTKESKSSSEAALLDAVELLATHSSYTSNTIKFYLDQFYEAEKLTLHNEEVYEYLKTTYNFNIED